MNYHGSKLFHTDLNSGILIRLCEILLFSESSTGELSLTGKVLPVGGIKEKVLAARRSGADTVILPTGCKGDFDELPQYVREKCHHCVKFRASYN